MSDRESGQARETASITGGRSLTLFRIGGIDVRLDLSWLLIFALILVSLAAGYFPNTHPGHSTLDYAVAGLVATLLFFGSILAHEFSHAVVARLSGVRVPAITLFLFGGVSHMEDEAASPGQELRIAAVGPLASFALAGVFAGVHAVMPGAGESLAAGVVLYLAWINAALGVFNLLPGFPLDGGRVLRALAWWRTGSIRRATRIAADAGKGLAIGLMVLGGLQIFAGALLGGVWLILIGMFLRGTAEAGYQSLVLLQTLKDVTVADVAIRDPVTVSPDLSVQQLLDDYLLAYGYRAFPVVDGVEVLGLISVTDLGDLPAEKRADTTVRERMRPRDQVPVVSPDLDVTDAMKRLAAGSGERLLVMRGDELAGLLPASALSRYVEIRRVLEGDDAA